jgi:hypothetical protein
MDHANQPQCNLNVISLNRAEQRLRGVTTLSLVGRFQGSIASFHASFQSCRTHIEFKSAIDGKAVKL